MNLRQLVNMNLGFLGIQFGWSLQMANMSAIYEQLGASPEQIPGLWLAAPLTGLLVQPIVGYCSDRTWGRLGRRRPYFLVGAILSSLALLVMPHAGSLRQAAILLWILDASINISMEPFRAFVSDLLDPDERPRGFAMQSLMIGLGAVIASALPYLLSYFTLPASGARLAPEVAWAFYLGALAFITSVAWTVVTTNEPPPLLEFTSSSEASPRVAFPPVLLRLAPVQILTWFGLFCMWLYFAPTVAYHIFGATSETDPLYRKGVAWAGVCFSAYSLVTFCFSMLLPRLARRWGSGMTHGCCLAAGGLGLIGVGWIDHSHLLLLSMVGVGIAWTSILSLPYAMLSSQLQPGNTGLWMGVFNACIVLPEIAVALGFGWVMKELLHNNRLAAVQLGGACLLLAACLSWILLREQRSEP